jgi:hypothetical protein
MSNKKSIKDKYIIQIVPGGRIPLECRKLIEKHHYSKTARSQMPIYTYKLLRKNRQKTLVGVAVVGIPCGKKVRDKYGIGAVELRRFVTLDTLEKNVGSFFLSRIIKHLKSDPNLSILMSYADPNYGHIGTLYKASNFQYLGRSNSNNPKECIYEGKKYSKREVYQKNPKTKTYRPKAQFLLNMLKTGQAYWKKLERKHVYSYNL